MADLESEFHFAWRRVAACFDDDGVELARRLARRRRAVLVRPPRAWCLALRASDARLPEVATLLPADAADTARAASRALQRGAFVMPHADRVRLTAAALRQLCAPVHLDPPGETLDEVARKLGTTPVGLRNARLNGLFDVHHVQGLMGRRGRPVPLLYAARPLDPSARNFAAPDRAWLWTASYLPGRIPHDFAQTLTRIECFRAHVPRTRYADDETLHPELRDAPAPPASAKRSRRLPPPEPDHVWYKWSTAGHFLGDDPSNWRKSPNDPGDRPPRWRTRRRSKPRPPRPPQPAGSLHFNGYTWLCPVCGRTCRTIYCPLPRLNLLDLRSPEDRRRFPGPLPKLADIVDIPKPPLPPRESFPQEELRHAAESTCALPPPLRGRAGVRGNRVESSSVPPPNDPDTRTLDGFACARCHRVRFFSRITPAAWNGVVAYLTGGLLYGYEVPRPAWFTKDRKLPYRPQLGRAPSARRQQVLERWIQGHSRRRIARDLNTGVATVCKHVKALYRQHNVHDRFALIAAVGGTTRLSRTPRRDDVLKRLLAGQPYRQIATELNLSKQGVQTAANRIYRAHGVHTRAALQRLHDVPTPPSFAELRAEVARRLAAGQSCAQIARETGRTYHAVYHDKQKLRRPPVRASAVRE